jgi:hypothetical protein
MKLSVNAVTVALDPPMSNDPDMGAANTAVGMSKMPNANSGSVNRKSDLINFLRFESYCWYQPQAKFLRLRRKSLNCIVQHASTIPI